MSKYRHRVIVKIVAEVPYAADVLPVGLVITAIRKDPIIIVNGVERNIGGDPVYACRTTSGSGIMLTLQYVVEVEDKKKRFLYHIKGQYIDA